ncbi:MAG: hypothetical protein ACI88A_004291, partial [Paraglaciecola sp.]
SCKGGDARSFPTELSVRDKTIINVNHTIT